MEEILQEIKKPIPPKCSAKKGIRKKNVKICLLIQSMALTSSRYKVDLGQPVFRNWTLHI